MKQKFGIICAFGLIGVMSVNANAAEYTLNQLVDLAISRSKQIGAAELDTKSREKEVSQASVWENPTLDLSTENKDQSGGSTRSWKIGASQPLAVPGKYSLRGEVAEAEFKISKIDRSSVELFLKHEILVKTYVYLAAEERSKHAEERLTRFREVQGFIRSRTFASPQKRAEATIVTGKLVVLEKELLNLHAQAEVLWEELNLYLGLAAKPKIRANWYRTGKSFSLEDLREKLAASNPSINRQKLILEKAEKQVKLAQKDSWPTPTVSGFYSDGNGISPEKIYGLGLSLPISIFNTNSAGVQASQFKSQAEATRLDLEREKTLLGLKSAFLRYESARSSIQHLSITRVPEIEKGMTITDQGFRKGQVDLLTYIEADSQHSDSLDAIYAAQTEYISYLSNLLALVGEPTIPLETQP